MTVDRALKLVNWAVLVLVVGTVLFCAAMMVPGCRTISEFFDGKATVNKSTILLAVLVAAAVGALVTGWFGILAGGGAGTATTWLSATSPDGTPLPAPHVPTFWESLWSFLGTTTGLVVAGLVLWALWNKREWIVKTFRGQKGFRLQAALHAIWGGSRFRPPDDTTRAVARLTKDSP